MVLESVETQIYSQSSSSFALVPWPILLQSNMQCGCSDVSFLSWFERNIDNKKIYYQNDREEQMSCKI